MNAEDLAKIEAEATHPKGIAARIESTDLKRLLEERDALLAALMELRLEACHFMATKIGVQFLKIAIEQADDALMRVGTAGRRNSFGQLYCADDLPKSQPRGGG